MSRRTRSESKGSRRWWRRPLALVVWYLIPSFIALVAIGYTYGALVWHVDPPAVAVEGTSMLPTLHTGDLVFLMPANPHTLKKGDIIAVRVPTQSRTTYGLPANVVHRIVRIEHTSSGLIFITKGDNNPGNDVFTTAPGSIVGRLRYVVPGAGYAFLFVQSRPGEITLGALALIGLLYFFFGLLEERRTTTREALGALEAALIETQRFEKRLTEYQLPRGGEAPRASLDATMPVIQPGLHPPAAESIEESEPAEVAVPEATAEGPLKKKDADVVGHDKKDKGKKKDKRSKKHKN